MGEHIEITDLEAAEHVLSRSYANLRIDRRGQLGRVRNTQDVLTSSVRLDRNRFTMSFGLTGTPLGVLTIAHLRGGRPTYRSAGSERPYGRGNVFFAAQPEDPYAVSSVNADIEVAVVDPGLLAQVAQTEPGRVPAAVRFTGYEPISAQAVYAWKNTFAYIRDAVMFIDEHAHEDVTIAEIAEAACVTIRAVQLAFRRHLSTTPMEYLRRVRLDHAHRDLLAADPGKVKVTDVACRWGFASTSRFITVYRQAFGVAPGNTLRN